MVTNGMIVIENNSNSAYKAAIAAEKEAAKTQALALASEHGIREDIAINNSTWLMRKIVEERQVKYTSANPESVRLKNFFAKCAACK